MPNFRHSGQNMVMVELKGLHTVKAKGRTYHYAWRGGPAVKGEPGTPEFMDAYNEAIAGRAATDGKRFRSVVIRYRASDEYKALAESTRGKWSRWLDRIVDYFGDLRTAQFSRTEKIRPHIKKWRAQYASTPRTADMGMQVLSRVCSYGVDTLAEISSNPCDGIKQLYSVDRSEIIWTDDDLATLKAKCSAEIWQAVELAAHTGLRVSDLIKLSWSHIGDHAIVMKTGKRSGRSKKVKEAIIPIYADLRAIIDRIPKRATTVLTSSKKRPWTYNGLASSFRDAKAEVWPEGDDLHFHDLRGTAATKFYLAGLTIREIAEVLAWDEEAVDKIIRRYVGRKTAILERIRKMDAAKQGT
jgi:integrase